MRATRRTWARHALRLGFALLSLLLVAFANVGTQGTGSYVNCMIVKSGMPKVSYRLMVLIAMVYVGSTDSLGRRGGALRRVYLYRGVHPGRRSSA